MVESLASQRLQIDHTGFALVKIDGVSMRPLIWGGQHLAAVKLLDGEPSLGDLLAFMFMRNGKNVGVVHRLVEIKDAAGERLYITRGDNCLGCEQVHREDIIGRVAEVHRVSGFRPWHIIPAAKFAVTDPCYRRYVRFWTAIWPVRRLYYLFRSHVRGLSIRIQSIFKRK